MTPTNFEDAFGAPLYVGDEVTYVYSNFGDLILCRARVSGETDSKVRIVLTEYRVNGVVNQNKLISADSGRPQIRPVGDEKLVESWALVKDRK